MDLENLAQQIKEAETDQEIIKLLKRFALESNKMVLHELNNEKNINAMLREIYNKKEEDLFKILQVSKTLVEKLEQFLSK